MIPSLCRNYLGSTRTYSISRFTLVNSYHFKNVSPLSYLTTQVMHQQSNQLKRRKFNASIFQSTSTNYPTVVYSRQFQTTHLPQSSKASRNGTGSTATKGPLPLALLLLTATFSAVDKVYSETAIDEKLKRIIEKTPNKRTTDERIELFHYLLEMGKEEAEKAKEKDVIVFFGNTDAGKSTLINFLYGCQMKQENRRIVVDPNSTIKEVTPIGDKLKSCTLIPKQIPEIQVPIRYLNSPETLTFYDMPGLSDNRGIEIELANTIVMKQIVEKANSVRLVMVVEHGQLILEKGVKWTETLKLLEERFSDTVGKDNLCIMVTKNNDVSIDTIKEDISSHSEEYHIPNLSNSATVYDPIKSNRINVLKDLFSKTKTYEKLETSISMSKNQLWDAVGLGRIIQDEIAIHLKSEDNEQEIDKAVKKIKFTYEIAKLGSRDLTLPHQFAETEVTKLASRIVTSTVNEKLAIKINQSKKYQFLKEKFGNYVSFKDADDILFNIKASTQDPRLVAYEKGRTAPLSFVGTCLIAAVSTAFPPLWFVTAGGTVFTAYAAKRYCKPSQGEKDTDDFFKDANPS